MKSAYELAMERLNKTSPLGKVTAVQKKEIAKLESKYKAKIAERELTLNDEANKAAGAGDFEKMQGLQQQLVRERKALQAELEEKKEKVRQSKS